MRKYLFKRIAICILTVWVIVTLNFLLFRMLPGDPVRLMFTDPRISVETMQRLRSTFGLEEPLYMQYLIYLGNLAKGEWGVSFFYREPVLEIVGGRLLNTLLLLIPATVLSVLIGSLLGVISAWKRGSKIDTSILNISLVLWSMPVFWLGLILVIALMGILPISGIRTPGIMDLSIFEQIIDTSYHMILPVVTLSLAMIGQYMLIMRGSLIDVLTEDYITTAKSKGFGDPFILRKHAVPNAMLPVITLIAMNLGLVVGGAIQTETVFSWPGVGRLMFDSIMVRDYPALQGAFLVIAVSVVLASFTADILYTRFDPRVRLD